MKFVTLRATLGAVVVGLALVAGHTASDARAATADRPFATFKPVASPLVSPQFATLEEAVAAGKLDRAVVDVLRADGAVEALVTFEHPSLLTRSIAAGAHSPSGLKELAADVRRTFTGYESRVFRSAEPGAYVLDELGNLPLSFVRFTSADALLDVLNGSGVTGVRENLHGTAATTESLQLIRQPAAVAAGHRGNGTYVAVLDTGVNYLHSDFGCTGLGTPSSCRVTHAQEFADTDGKLDDGSFHGSNVAGIVAKVAPGTKILAFDVFQWFTRYENGVPYPSHEWTSDAVAAAINRAITLKGNGLNIVAMNLSIGVSNTFSTGTCGKGWSLEGPFALAHDWGILPVVASGNDAIDAGYFQNGISYPACLADAFSVGAVHDSAHPGVNNSSGYCEAGSAADALTSFTQSGPNLDIIAPGSCLVAGGRTMNGTSQAAPHVAGAAAILAAARFGSSRFYEQDLSKIEGALRSSGKPIYDNRNGDSTNRLDIPAALQALGTGGSTDTTAPSVSWVKQFMPSFITTPGSVVDAYNRVQVTGEWAASDSGSGVAELDVEFATNGTWQQLSTPSATQTSVTMFTPTGTNTYQFAVRAKDGAGNWSSWIYGPTFRLTVVQESSASVVYRRTWSTASWASAFGGQLRVSNQVGATARLSFTGTGVAVIGTIASNRGQATFSVTGGTPSTRTLTSASTLARTLMYAYWWTTSGTRTVEVKVASGTVDVDAFVVMS